MTTKTAKLIKVAAACVLLSACNSDGSTNWDAVGNGILGLGSLALGVASAYQSSHTVYYQPVVVCRPWWAC